MKSSNSNSKSTGKSQTSGSKSPYSKKSITLNDSSDINKTMSLSPMPNIAIPPKDGGKPPKK